MKRFLVFCVAGSLGWAAAPLGSVAQSACTLYKVVAPILDVVEDAEKPDKYIDVLESGDVACVTKEQQAGGQQWGFVEHKQQPGGADKPVNGWVGLRYMVAHADGAASAPAAAPKTAATEPQAPPPAEGDADVLRFDQPVPFGPFPVRGKSLQELAAGVPLFSPIEGLDEGLWQKQCTTCHKWNQERLCEQGSSYIKSAKAVFRHQHPYGGPYKLALMRWAKSGCK